MDQGRESAAHFASEAEARVCADGLRARPEVQNIQLLDDDGEPLI